MPEYGLVGARLPSRREVFVREGAEEGGRAAREKLSLFDGKTIYYDYFAPVLHHSML